MEREFKKICEECVEIFVTKDHRKRFCSIECGRAHSWKIRKNNPRYFTCLVCGKTFMSFSARKYCSNDCKLIANGRKKRRNVLTKEPSFAIEEVCLMARNEGLSYGQYVAKYNLQ